MLGRKKSKIIQRRKIQIKIKKKYLIALGVLAIFVLGFFVFKGISIVKKINYQISNSVCIDESNVENSFNVKGKNIFSVDSDQISKDLQRKYPCIRSVSLIKKLPDSLDVKIEVRKPKLVLNVLKVASDSGEMDTGQIGIASGSAFFLSIPDRNLVMNEVLVVDENGVVFSDDPIKYPAIQTDLVGGGLKIGQFGGEFLINSIKILEKLSTDSFNITKSLILDDRALIVQSDERVIFSLKKNPDYQLASLQLILQKAKMSSSELFSTKMDSKVIQTIDLRFDKPVITYSPKKR